MGAEQSGMIDPGCMEASFGILSLGMRTALRGEMLVLSGTALKKVYLIEGFSEGGKCPATHQKLNMT